MMHTRGVGVIALAHRDRNINPLRSVSGFRLLQRLFQNCPVVFVMVELLRLF